MILRALNQYYDRLAGEPDLDTAKAKVPPFGYSEEQISFVIVISTLGELIDIVPHMEQIGSKKRAKRMFVPASSNRSGQYTEKTYDSGKDNAFFLWDKTAYSLGVDLNPDRKSSQPWVESKLTFKSFRRLHARHLSNTEDDGLKALLFFIDRWNPSDLALMETHRSVILGTNVVFQLDGDHCYLHERDAAKALWEKLLSQSAEQSVGNCLVTGSSEKIARLHPSIKGVYGGQSSGGSIVSFNADSYESYGKIQGENAPVSEISAFKYTTALNYLLNRDNKHCLSVGDTSTVFWAVADDGGKAQKAERLFMQAVNPSDDSEAALLKPIVEQIAQGRPLTQIAPDIDPQTRFYLLGLAPNASRISIRYWLDTSFGELERRMSEHYSDLSLKPSPWNTLPSIWRLLIELVPYRSGKKPKSDEIPPHLAGELMRAILTGDRYPYSLVSQIVTRIRSDGHISPLRIALIKAVLQRNYRKHLITEEIPMSLDESNDNKAYLLGRLFAVLERIQSSAVQGANASITDRYYGTAASVPYSVFPRLLAGSNNHISKIRKKIPGYAVNLEKDVMAVIAKLPNEFPKHFSIEEQGRFAIGYYHQREKYFSSSKPDSIDSSEAS